MKNTEAKTDTEVFYGDTGFLSLQIIKKVHVENYIGICG